MFRQTGIWLLGVVLLLPTLSCTRLPEQPPEKGAILGSEQLPASDSIPSEWGKLVSVSTTPIYQGWFQLWFQDETGKVRMVPFNLQTRQFNPRAIVVPRK